jgi:simple sugar transport system ATP-binding protein
MSTDTSVQTSILEARNITKSFEAVRALRGVSLEVHAGEVVGLVGDNGAGKSTLVKVLSGTIRPDSGQVVVDGRERDFNTANDARKAGIETVFQDLSLIHSLDITQNVFLNRELFRAGLLGRLLFTDDSRMRRDLLDGFAKLGLSLPQPETKVAALSGGQRQAVAIARAVLWGSHIVLLDEPNAALGVKQTEIVLSFIERLKEHRVGVIFISHNMEYVFRVSDRIVVLRLGQKVFEGARSAVTQSEIVSHITGAK